MIKISLNKFVTITIIIIVQMGWDGMSELLSERGQSECDLMYVDAMRTRFAPLNF